jgi:hypothetical protein
MSWAESFGRTELVRTSIATRARGTGALASLELLAAPVRATVLSRLPSTELGVATEPVQSDGPGHCLLVVYLRYRTQS